MDGEFFDGLAEDDGLGGDFGAELEAVADEVHIFEDVSAEGFVAGGFVGDFYSVEQADGEGEEDVDDFVGEGHSGVEAVEKAGAVDDGGFAFEDGLDEAGDLFGSVF